MSWLFRFVAAIRRYLFAYLFVPLLVLFFSSATSPAQAQSPSHYSGIEQIPYYALTASSTSEGDSLDGSDLPQTRVVLQSYRTGNWDIFSAQPMSGGVQQITNNPALDIHPRIRKGGDSVIFASNRAGNFEIYRARADGSQLVRLTYTGADDVQPVWRPDGRMMAFESYRNGQAEIYQMDENGLRLKRLTTNAAFDGQPSWSPDGSRLAFVSNRSGSYRIYTMNADGGDV
ncbi:MAG: PD40 domain-containing protein, partial [Anaerolineales bacterium]|nr:PD40 domain-containing protein [Anaerolineales bacterium]